jgi:glycosyltransferase involved in cell wall biosynthesis
VTTESHPPLRVAVDATSLLGPRTGVGTFTHEVLAGLARRGGVEATAFAVSWRGRGHLAAEVPDGVRVGGVPLPARAARLLWRHADLPDARLLARPCDVVHGPNFVVPPGGGAAEVVTVHDLTAIHHPELCTADSLQWPSLLERALRRGAWVNTVSEFVACEVREHFDVDPERVVAVPNGLSPPLPPGPGTDGAAGRHLAGGPRYVLALGTVEPRKELPVLVRAFDALAADDPELRLVIAGPDGWGAEALTAAVDRARHRRRIVRLGWVSAEQRVALLRGAAALAYPSRYEGFGLVPLEALAVGTPAVATTAGALPEILGDAAPLVPPGDVDALAAALGRVLADRTHRAGLLAAGASQVARYRWERTVDGLVELYQCAIRGR